VTGAHAITRTFRPVGRLADFDGSNVAGTWTMEIHDTVRNQTGTLNSWSLVIEE
jgi:subtilisin-like proprotein convertase family protein